MKRFIKQLSEKTKKSIDALLKDEYSRPDHQEFKREYSLMILQRLKVLSLFVMLMMPVYVIFDIQLIQHLQDRIYTVTVISIHILLAVNNLSFLAFFQWIYKRLDAKQQLRWGNRAIWLGIGVVLLLATVSSINSQRLTGNIYTYILLVLGIGLVCPYEPSRMIPLLAGNHLVFMTGIFLTNPDIGQLFSKQVNATGTVVVSALLTLILYRLKMNEFIARKKLEESETNLVKLFDITPHPMIIIRMQDWQVVRASQRTYHDFDLLPQDVTGEYIRKVFADPEELEQLIKDIMKDCRVYNRVLKLRVKGTDMWCLTSCECIDYMGEECVLCSIMDITHMKELENTLARLATTDMLTGILNRRAGLEILQDTLDQCHRTGTGFVLCFIDINDLKDVNDMHGHTEGDQYILTVCRIIQSCLDESDIFFRMGGDEFIVLFQNKELETINQVWDRIVSSLNQEHLTGGKPYPMSVSHGLFHCKPDLREGLDKIIELADERMYRDKLEYRRRRDNGTADVI